MTTETTPQPQNQIKRALRNSALITLVVGAVTHLQGDAFGAVLMTMAFTFAIITPALWLSYRFTAKLLKPK